MHPLFGSLFCSACLVLCEVLLSRPVLLCVLFGMLGSALYSATSASLASDTASHVSFKVVFGTVCFVRRFVQAACFVRR